MKPDGIYKSVTTREELTQLCNHLQDKSIVAIDTETTSLDTLNCGLLGVSISPDVGFGYYIPTQQNLSGKQVSIFDRVDSYLSIEEISKALNPVLGQQDVHVCMHNSKFDLHVLERHGFKVNNYFDTMLAAWVLGNTKNKRYGLKHLSKDKFGIKMLEYKEVTKGTKFSNLPLVRATEYAAPDSDMTLRLAQLEMDVLESYPKLQEVLKLEHQVVPVLMEMERNGVLINTQFLEAASEELRKDINYYTGEIYKQARNKFNIRSSQQVLSNINRLISPVIISNTLESTLDTVINEHPIVKLIIEFRKRDKLRSTFVEGVLKKIDKKTNRLHTDFYQMLVTGRCSSSPNMQNLPTEFKLGERDLPLVRTAIIARPGWKIVSIDYSQLELRVITHLSQDPTWLNAFLNNRDVHQETADVINKPRKAAKTINFALIYGTSEYGLAPRLGMSVPETREFIDYYFNKLPGVRQYILDREREVQHRGYVESIFGRRLYFNIDKNNPRALPAAKREGVNFPVQAGASGDIVKKAMVEVYGFLMNNDYNVKMLLQVHDEIVFEVKESDMHVIPKIKDIMENVVQLSIPLKCDVEYGDNWQEMSNL